MLDSIRRSCKQTSTFKPQFSLYNILGPLPQQHKQAIPFPGIMAYNQVDYLEKVASDGFAIIEEHFGRGSSQGQFHHRKPAPNQYPRREPDEPSFKNYRPSTKQCHETWYFLPVPQNLKQEGAVISSRQAAENYGGILFMDYDYKSKPSRWGYNYN
ncbi:hypothetical protein V6N13_022938 [Hibiscus sabdariffa]|uniref:Uncharacterized protein n=2 Tax=Hibiscus sabdariffa TaxID=183260 RepID=A0ABR2A8L9_9ROSI